MAKPMYQVGDLFTTTASKVTGKIKEIIPVNASTTTLLLDVDGEDRYTSVKFQKTRKWLTYSHYK